MTRAWPSWPSARRRRRRAARRVRVRGRPADRPRPRLLHRHGLRDQDGRLRELGSVCSGGRYDSLASDGRTTYPGVGISFGVTPHAGSAVRPRALAVVAARAHLRAGGAAGRGARAPSCDAVAAALRARGHPRRGGADAPQKYGKQIRYAERRGIPYVWFPAQASADGVAAVRDIRTGEQVPADAVSGCPPAADLRPAAGAPGRLTDVPSASCTSDGVVRRRRGRWQRCTPYEGRAGGASEAAEAAALVREATDPVRQLLTAASLGECLCARGRRSPG